MIYAFHFRGTQLMRNNKFYFKVGSTVYVKIIPSGNYSITTFNAIIVALMNSVQNTFSANVNITSNTVGISTSINSTNYQQIVDGKTITYATTFEIFLIMNLGY